MRKLVILSAAVLGVCAQPAQAKQVSSVIVCGASGCRSIDGSHAFLDRFNVYLPPAHRPDRASRARWFLVRVTIHEPGSAWPAGTWRTRFYPDAETIYDRSDGWRKVPQSTLLAYRQGTAGVVPFGHAERAVSKPVAQPARSAGEADHGGSATLTPAAVVLALLAAGGGVGVWRFRAQPRGL